MIRVSHHTEAKEWPGKEIDRHPLQAEHLYQTVIDCQFHVSGQLDESIRSPGISCGCKEAKLPSIRN